MPTHKPCILINAGTETRRNFMHGMEGYPCTSYRSKEMLLHIHSDGTQHFIYRAKEISLDSPYVFIRLRDTDTHFCGLLAEYLHHHHIATNDPIHLSYNFSAAKISQMVLLSLAGITIPESYIFREESFRANEEYLRSNLLFPLVYKLDGSKGRNVKLLSSFEELVAEVRIKPRNRLALVQPFISNTFDTRTLVFKEHVFGSISRTRTHGFLNNIAQGAQAAVFHLSDADKAIAIRAAKACRIDFAGVDMIHTEDGPVVLEVNKSPQVGGFESVHHFKVFSRLAEIIRATHS